MLVRSFQQQKQQMSQTGMQQRETGGGAIFRHAPQTHQQAQLQVVCDHKSLNVSPAHQAGSSCGSRTLARPSSSSAHCPEQRGCMLHPLLHCECLQCAKKDACESTFSITTVSHVLNLKGYYPLRESLQKSYNPL